VLSERTDAEERFLEQTPWANPHHPAHASAPVNAFHSQPSQPFFATPAQPRRYADENTLNGSASTVDIMSNPPSSAAHGAQVNYTDLASDTPVPVSRNHALSVDRIQTSHSSSSAHQTHIGTMAMSTPSGSRVSEHTEPSNYPYVFPHQPRPSPISHETLTVASNRPAIASGGPGGRLRS